MIKKITDLAVNAQQQFSTLAIDLVAFNIKAKKKLAVMLKERDELITMFSLFEQEKAKQFGRLKIFAYTNWKDLIHNDLRHIITSLDKNVKLVE